MSKNACCSCSTAAVKKKILIYACSGAANVAEIADRAARQLTAEGAASMFCLAGIGAQIPSMIETAKSADLNVVIDGCPLDCAKICFQKAGLTNVKIIRVTDHGIEKSKGVKITDQQVQNVAALARQAIAAA